jgi:core tail protein
MAYLKGRDVISGQEGTAFIQINGRNEFMFYVKELEATVKKQKEKVRTLNRRGTQNKATGFEGEGKMTIYGVTSQFKQMMLDYMKNGRDTFFDIQITNDDATSSIGRQTTVLRECNLDEVVMGKLNVEDEFLEEEVNFTFEDVDLLESFKTPTLG